MLHASREVSLSDRRPPVGKMKGCNRHKESPDSYVAWKIHDCLISVHKQINLTFKGSKPQMANLTFKLFVLSYLTMELSSYTGIKS